MAVSSTGTSTLVSPDLEARTIAWRRHLHANPELSFEEHETADFVEHPPVMGGEDFSAYGTAAPAAFFWVGSGNEELGTTWPHHHPPFDIDEAALKHGTAVFVRTALDVLA